MIAKIKQWFRKFLIDECDMCKVEYPTSELYNYVTGYKTCETCTDKLKHGI